MNLKSGIIEVFDQYSQFTSLKDFNNHLEMWLVVHKHEFSKGELVGLKRLARFAAKIPGVSNAKIGTILKAIHKEYHDNGISRSTFKRMILKAKKLQILTVYETERKNGSQSSNLYVFNRFSNNEPPKVEKMNHHNKTIVPFKTNNQEINKRNKQMPNNKHLENQELNNIEEKILNRSEVKLDHSFVNDRVPKPFVQLVKYFLPEAKTIEEFWHMTQIAAYRNNREKEPGQVLDIAINSFKQLVSKLKSAKSIKKPIAYYFGILEKKFEKLYFEELDEMGFGDCGNGLVFRGIINGEMISIAL